MEYLLYGILFLIGYNVINVLLYAKYQININDIDEKSGEYVFVDVRNIAEVSGGSTIPKSINIPLDRLKSSIDELKKYKEKKIVLYCLSGARSLHGVKILKANGFQHVFSLKGGIYAYNRK